MKDEEGNMNEITDHDSGEVDEHDLGLSTREVTDPMSPEAPRSTVAAAHP